MHILRLKMCILRLKMCILRLKIYILSLKMNLLPAWLRFATRLNWGNPYGELGNFPVQDGIFVLFL